MENERKLRVRLEVDSDGTIEYLAINEGNTNLFKIRRDSDNAALYAVGQGNKKLPLTSAYLAERAANKALSELDLGQIKEVEIDKKLLYCEDSSVRAEEHMRLLEEKGISHSYIARYEHDDENNKSYVHTETFYTENGIVGHNDYYNSREKNKPSTIKEGLQEVKNLIEKSFNPELKVKVTEDNVPAFQDNIGTPQTRNDVQATILKREFDYAHNELNRYFNGIIGKPEESGNVLILKQQAEGILEKPVDVNKENGVSLLTEACLRAYADGKYLVGATPRIKEILEKGFLMSGKEEGFNSKILGLVNETFKEKVLQPN